MLLTENQYQTIELNDTLSLIKITWHPATKSMSFEEFKDESLLYIQLLKLHRPKKILFKLKDLLFPLTPEIQEWTDKNVIAVEKEICEKLALDMPSSFIEELSVEQLAEEEHAKDLGIKLFDNERNAIEWLME